MKMNFRPSICYLCGEPLAGETSADHVPPRQFYASDLRRKHTLNLLTIPVHKSCNEGFQHDEDYFVYSLMPLVRGSYSGDELRTKILDDCQQVEQRRLLGKVLREFEHRPSGLILPAGTVVKSFEGDRILRVAWKIVRGLYFAHFGTFLPDDAPRACEIVTPGEPPPVPFFFLPEQPINGRYPAVFDYRFRNFPKVHNVNYWAMLLWDRLILIMKFLHPACGCGECTNSPRLAGETREPG